MEDDAILEARKKAKRSGEEDPLVVAQRFLNIYRQIHIFSPDKKESFNKMVLELPPEIRGMFGQLPGGILLQEYVDELAEQRGIEKSIHTSAETQNLEETDSKQAKILATALAQAQVQASAQMQAMGMSPAAPIATNAPVQTAPAKLSLDKDFAKEFAATLGNVLQQNSNTQNDELKNIVLALNQGHLSFLKTMQTENQAHREEMKKISLAMLQIQQKAANSAQTNSPQNVPANEQPTSASSESKQLMQMLISNQQNVLEKIAKLEAQTQNLSVSQSPLTQNVDNTILWQKSEQTFEKIASLLCEGQKNTSLEISKLINDNQQNIIKILSQNNNLNQNSGNASASNNIQINSSDYSAVLNSIAEKLGALSMPAANIEVKFPKYAFGDLLEAQSRLYQDMAIKQTQELSSIITTAFKESQKASTQSIIDALKSNQQPIIMSQPVIMNPGQNSFNCDLEKKTNIEEAYDIYPLESQFDSSKTEDMPISEKKKKKKKKKKLVEENFAEIEDNSNFFAVQASNNIDIQEEAPFEDNDQSVSDFDFFDVHDNVTEDTSYEQQNLEQEHSVEENSFLNDVNDVPVETIGNIEDTNIPQNNKAEELTNEQEASDFDFFDNIVTDIENIETNEVDLSEKIDNADSWGFSSDDSNTNETTESIDINSSGTSPDDWGFYADASLSTEDNDAGEGIDWEWEYVEEGQIPSANTNEDSPLTPLGVNSMLYTGEIIFDSKSILGSQKTTSNVQNSITFSNATIIDSFNDESETKDPYLK